MASDPAPAIRTVETVRPPPPASVTRQKTAPSMRPRPLSIVERHVADPFCCTEASCTELAEGTAVVEVGALAVVAMLCRTCAKQLPEGVRFVPIAKVGR